MATRRTIYVGTNPPPAIPIDWVVEPAARVERSGVVATPSMGVLNDLLRDAKPVLDDLCTGDGRLLRDEYRQLILSVARAEATAREFAETACEIVQSPRLSRPSRPGRLGEGLSQFLDAPLARSGPPWPRRLPVGAIGQMRALRWSRGRPATGERPIVLAVGGPSERRALEPVLAHLDPGSAVMLDFGLDSDSELDSFGSFLSTRDALAGVGSRDLLAQAVSAWESREWWGRRWLPWTRSSLSATARITLREAVLFCRAAHRALDSAAVLVTAKVRFARARAILKAAEELGVKTIGMQHGIYVVGLDWTDTATDVFAVTGASSERGLLRDGYRGEIREVGAPFFTVAETDWDCGIALQPPEGVVVMSAADYTHHARTAYEAARRAFGDHASIGFRLHPREDEQTLRTAVGATPLISRDPTQGAATWISIESSFVVEAMLSGSRVVLLNLNEHQWEYPFADMPGIRVATSPQQLEQILGSPDGSSADAELDTWRGEFAVATGDEAGAAVADIVREALR